MKVVLDTNVLISARIAKAGNPAKILKYVLEHAEEVKLLTSSQLLAEVRRVFQYPRVKRKYHLTDRDIDLYITTVQDACTVVDVQSVIAVVRDDPDDDQVLACALEGQTNYIVSGDPHLLTLKEHEGIAIVSPSDFVVLLLQHFDDERE